MIQRQRIFPGVFLLLLCACGGTSTQPTVAQNGIEPSSMKYNKVFSANEQGFAKVNVGEGSDYAEGIIDGKGNEVIAPRTDMLVNDITGAQALVQRGREFLFVDLDLGLVDADALSTEKGYQYAEPFRCGRAMVQVDDRWFYIDSLGSQLFGATYDFAETFHYDRAMVKEGEHYRIIDTEGKPVARMNYDQVSPYSPWRWQVTNIKGDVYWSGFVDLEGREAVPLIYDDVLYFDPEENRTRAGFGGRFGYLNELGEAVIPVQYEYAEIFDKGKARVMLNGRQFFIDHDGKEVADQ